MYDIQKQSFQQGDIWHWEN